MGFLKGHKPIPKQQEMMRKRIKENHPNWKGGKRDLRREVLLRYGITKQDYTDLFVKQNGVCAICGKPEVVRKNLSIDHDHRCCTHHKSCGKCIRGLLCFRCNQALGLMNDDILILKSAIEYLTRTA